MGLAVHRQTVTLSAYWRETGLRAAQLNGITIHYREEGPPGGLPLVFVNSLGTDFRLWDGVCERLNGRFRLIRYDKRGHGLSAAPPPPYQMTDHVKDLAALLDHLGVKRAVIIGVSVGGMIAQGLYGYQPERIAGLILSNTAHKIGTEELWNDRIAAVETDGLAAIADNVLERWFSPQYRAAETASLTVYRHMLTRTPAAGYVGTCAALRDADYTEIASAIAVPAHLVAGSTDGATPPDLVRSTHDLIAGSSYTLVEGVGHLPMIERPGEMAALINGFIKEHGLG